MDGEANGSWPSVPLGEVAELIMGQAPAGSTVAEWDGAAGAARGLPFIQGNAEFGRRFPSPAKWCSEPSKIALPGDYLISVRAPVGELNEVNTKLAIGRGLAAIRFRGVHDRFGWQALWQARGEFARVAQGSTFDAINSRDLAGLRIPCPPQPIQISIARVLDAIDDAIEKTEDVIAATEDVRKALLQELLTRGVPGWHSEWKTVPGIGTIPACWDVVRGESIFKLGGGYAPADFTFTDEGDALFLKVDDLNALGATRYVTDATLKWFAAAHPRIKPVPTPFIVLPKRGAAIFQNRVSIVRRSAVVDPNLMTVQARAGVNLEWVRYLFSHTQLPKLADNSGVPQLNNKHILPHEFPLPSEREQSAIAALLASLEDSEQSERAVLCQLVHAKAAVAEALLSGRVRVPRREEVAQ